MSNSTGIILVMEVLGAALVTLGIGLVFMPAAIVAAGIFCLVFAFAIERSRA